MPAPNDNIITGRAVQLGGLSQTSFIKPHQARLNKKANCKEWDASQIYHKRNAWSFLEMLRDWAVDKAATVSPHESFSASIY